MDPSASDVHSRNLHFFLSYAHTPAFDQAEHGESDKLVKTFYDDLCKNVAAADNVSPGATVAFVDLEARSGDDPGDWSKAAREALATCRVFVPLYSPRYFASEWCGREWSAFAARSHDAIDAIVPVLWAAVPLSDWPDVARAVRFEEYQDGESDLYSLMTVDRYRDRYKQAVYRIARRIRDVARNSAGEPGRPVDPKDVANSFVPPAHPRLHIVVLAAGDGDDSSSLRWTPFGAAQGDRLADVAARLASNLDFEPVLNGFDEAVGELMRPAPPSAPAVLIVDIRAFDYKRRREQLRQFDALDRPWVGVVLVVTEGADDARLARLRDYLGSTLVRRSTTGRIAARLAVTRGVASAAEFVRSFSAATELAAVQYLRHSQVDGSLGSE